ncbi:MAG TPA: hypothetical protein QF753_12175 [Victivallales bacterium]|nr:hypothetical protein [Victivallales bacterium]
MKNLKFYAFFIFSATFIILISSCSSINPKFTTKYTPEPFKHKNKISAKNTLFLLNVIDERPALEKIPFEPEANPLILIPLWPYTHANVNPLIRYCYFQPNIIETLQDLFITDLRVSGLFKRVTSSPFGEVANINNIEETNIPKQSYLLQIKIKKAVWSRYLTSYGLSYPGTVLWAFGAPMSFGHVKLVITASLYSPDNYKKPIAEIITSEQTQCTEFVYDQINYKPPISEFKLAQLFSKITDKLRIFLYSHMEK